MKYLFLLVFIPLFSWGQSLKEHLPSYSATFLAGGFDGLRDGFQFHNDGAGPFWNGKQSWLNKYKNRDVHQGPAFFGSTTFLAFTTDAAHLAGFFSHNFNAVALATAPGGKKGFWRTALSAVKYNAVYLTGRYIALSCFKQRIP